MKAVPALANNGRQSATHFPLKFPTYTTLSYMHIGCRFLHRSNSQSARLTLSRITLQPLSLLESRHKDFVVHDVGGCQPAPPVLVYVTFGACHLLASTRICLKLFGKHTNVSIVQTNHRMH